MLIFVARKDLRFTDKTLNDLAEFFLAANIRGQTGAKFYQYLLCPEYFDDIVMKLYGGNINVLH